MNDFNRYTQPYHTGEQFRSINLEKEVLIIHVRTFTSFRAVHGLRNSHPPPGLAVTSCLARACVVVPESRDLPDFALPLLQVRQVPSKHVCSSTLTAKTQTTPSPSSSPPPPSPPPPPSLPPNHHPRLQLSHHTSQAQDTCPRDQAARCEPSASLPRRR